MTYLLDVNALIALIDPRHGSHDAVHQWFAKKGALAWATCPITQNGAVRIVSQPKYTNPLDTPADALIAISGLVSHPGHRFWPDDISLLDATLIDPGRLLRSSQLTDTYLLALAKKHGGQLATLDRRLVTAAVPEGAKHLQIIGAQFQ